MGAVNLIDRSGATDSTFWNVSVPHDSENDVVISIGRSQADMKDLVTRGKDEKGGAGGRRLRT